LNQLLGNRGQLPRCCIGGLLFGRHTCTSSYMLCPNTKFLTVSWLGKTLGEVITKQITSRLIAQILSGSLLFTINLYDIWYAWQWNDQAIYGYLLISMGGLLSALGSIVGGLTVYFGLNPLGWAALLLIGMGVGLVIIMSSTPLEFWLANGPFGESHSIDLYLQDPLGRR
ncbi:hypothetical protein NLO86_27430, partial [Pseudomonas savastanoi]|nr:hypothetical protein [Pseudomonas savastanoi]